MIALYGTGGQILSFSTVYQNSKQIPTVRTRKIETPVVFSCGRCICNVLFQAFLNLYVDDTVTARRRSTVEDDNPPSPLGNRVLP